MAALPAACDDASDAGDAPPEAPTGLSAAAADGGAHLTWGDNSDNETEFMVMRKLESDADFATIATVPFDTIQYHDAPLDAGATYVYMVMAMNDGGEASSEQITFTAP